MSLFTKAEKKAQRLKMYVYGDTGTGKTVTLLHFPKVALIDTEKGTEHYGAFFDFYRIQTSDPDKVHKALDELLADPSGFKTFGIDPFTALYDSIIDKRIRQQRVKTGKADYILQPLDYKYIKGELKSLVMKMLALDMNVICTAPSKTLYSGDKDKFMEVLGTDADGPKQLPFMFDVVLELKVENEKRLAFVKKDRTNKLPINTWFDFSYKTFCDYIGIEELEREPVVMRQQEALNTKERPVKITYKGKDLFTAGIQPDSIKALEVLIKSMPDAVKEKLREDYSVDSVLDLRDDEAKLLISELTITE